MNALSLQDKVIFLTGGSDGIGWDCAKAYAGAGAKVVIFARGTKAVAKAATRLGAQHLGLVGDVSHDDEVKRAMKTTQIGRAHV